MYQSLHRISIEQTCYAIRLSVFIQDYHYVEHIIIDGGSSDGTHLLLSEFPNLLIASEPDRGMYDAINKGIHLASGQIIVVNQCSFLSPTPDWCPARILRIRRITMEAA